MQRGVRLAMTSQIALRRRSWSNKDPIEHVIAERISSMECGHHQSDWKLDSLLPRTLNYTSRCSVHDLNVQGQTIPGMGCHYPICRHKWHKCVFTLSEIPTVNEILAKTSISRKYGAENYTLNIYNRVRRITHAWPVDRLWRMHDKCLQLTWQKCSVCGHHGEIVLNQWEG